MIEVTPDISPESRDAQIAQWQGEIDVIVPELRAMQLRVQELSELVGYARHQIYLETLTDDEWYDNQQAMSQIEETPPEGETVDNAWMYERGWIAEIPFDVYRAFMIRHVINFDPAELRELWIQTREIDDGSDAREDAAVSGSTEDGSGLPADDAVLDAGRPAGEGDRDAVREAPLSGHAG